MAAHDTIDSDDFLSGRRAQLLLQLSDALIQAHDVQVKNPGGAAGT